MSSPIVTANLVTAAALQASDTALGNAGTADQWGYLVQALVGGAYVSPEPECIGFGTCGCPNGTSAQSCCGCPNPANPIYQRGQTVSAQQYLDALRAYQQQFVSNPAVNGGAPSSTGTTQVTTTPAPVTGASTNTGASTQTACPAGQTCQILGNGIPDAYVVLGGLIVVGLAIVIYLKERKK